MFTLLSATGKNCLLQNRQMHSPKGFSVLLTVIAVFLYVSQGMAQACTSPSGGQTSGFSHSTTTTSTITGISFNGTGADGYMVCTCPNNYYAHPTNGTMYSIGQVFNAGSGTPYNQTVQYVGISTSGITASTNLSANTKYYFNIWPYRNIGCTGGPVYLATYTQVVGNATTCPNQPANITIGTVTSTSAVINWTAAGGNAALTYKIEYKLTSSGTWTTAANNYGTLNTTSYTLNGLTAGNTYDIRITATNAGCSATSTSTSAITTGCTPSTINPSTINVCAGGSQVALTVSNPGAGSFGSLNGSATGTTVNYSGSLGNYYVESGSVAASGNTFIFTNGSGCQSTLTVNVNATPVNNTTTTAICNGGTSNTTKTLSGTGGTTWAIQSVTSGGTGTINGTTYTPASNTSGTVVIRYSASSGCYADKSFTVNSAPVINPASPSVCTNTSTPVSVTNAGGGSFGSLSGTGASGSSLSFVSVGNYNFNAGSNTGTANATFTNSSGCTNAFAATIGAGVTFSPSSPSLCSTGSTTFTTSVAGTFGSVNPAGATITNTGGNSYTINGNGAAAGSASAVFTPGGGGCTATLQFTITAAPTATITPNGPTSFCQGGSVTLTASSGSSYLWSPGGATTQSIQATSSGTYSVLVSNGANCSATSTGTTVTVNQTPTATITPSGPTSFCQGGSVTLTASGANSYLWSPGGATTQSVQATTSGTYTVVVSNGINCSATSTGTTVTVSPTPTASITAGGPTTFCQGGSVTLTAASAGSYLWSPGNETTQSITATTTGNYIVVASNGVNCSATSNATFVEVHPLPAAPVTSGDTTICSGAVTITATSAGNVIDWYSLSGGGNLLSQGSNTYTTSTQGTYYAEARNTTTGCVSATRTAVVVTVTSGGSLGNPVFGLGSTSSRCAGAGALTYNATATNSTSISYSLDAAALNAGNTINASTGEVTWNSSYTGAATITATATGCGASTATATHTVTVSASASPTIGISASPGDTICSGETVVFNSSITLGGSSPAYAWTKNGITVGNGTSTYTTNALAYGDSIVCQLTSNEACATPTSITSNTLHIIVNPVPATPVITQNGNLLQCSVAGTYQWFLNNNAINGANAQTYTATQSGTYMVAVTDANGCSSASAATSVTITGINETAGDINFSVYPNPAASNIVEVRVDATLIGRPLELLNINGQLLALTTLQTANQQLDITDLATGVYFFRVNGIAKKLVKLN